MNQALARFQLLLLRAACLALLLLTNVSYAVEKPEYDVVFNSNDIEYRLYKPYLIAITAVKDTSSYSKAANSGFMRLFRYISGDNISSTEIAMTAPVQQKSSQKIAMTAPVQQVETDQGWTLSFMLPSSFTLASAPQPTDAQVVIEEVPARLMAVLRYSGRWTEKNFKKQEARLRQELERAGIEILSTAESAVYNPPFMPPFMRHNEVMFEVSEFPTNQ